MNELKLMKGDPIEVKKGVKVYPLTLGEIADIGEETYNGYIRSFLLNKSILNQVDVEFTQEQLNELYKLNDLEFMIFLCSQDTSILYYFIESLKLFLKSNVTIDEINDNPAILIEHDDVLVELDNDLYVAIKKIILKQNFLKDSEDTHYKPANSKAKALLEKLKKVKEKVQKQNTEEGLSLKDVISIVSAYSNDLNILSVWNLTVNQLYETYLRIMLWDDYHNKIILLPHSSGDQSLDLKHWAIDINKIN